MITPPEIVVKYYDLLQYLRTWKSMAQSAVLFSAYITTKIKKDYDMQYLYYRIDVPATGYVHLDFHLSDVRYGYIYLYKGYDAESYIYSYYFKTDSTTLVANYNEEILMTPGTYYILYKNEGRYYDYTDNNYYYPAGSLRVKYTFEDLHISNLDTDNNDSISKASFWDYKKYPSIKGAYTFKSDDSVDMYKVQIESGEYSIKLESLRRCNYEIYDEDGYSKKSAYSMYNDAYSMYINSFTWEPKAGTYYIAVKNGSSYTGYYTLSLNKIVHQQSGSSGGSSSNSNSSSKSNYSNEWINGKWYDSNGNQNYKGTLSWKSNSNGWWVEDSQGWYPTNSWQKIDGIWYYFKPDGYMAANEYYYGYWFTSSGMWDSAYFISWMHDGKGWWISDKSGWWPSNKWLKIDGNWYYFKADGYMATNQSIDGYWLGADGVCR